MMVHSQLLDKTTRRFFIAGAVSCLLFRHGMMIAILGGLADVERDLICTPTAEGRSRANARGQHMGRPRKLTEVQKAEARRRRAQEATLKELALSYKVARDDFASRSLSLRRRYICTLSAPFAAIASLQKAGKPGSVPSEG
jgi:DNA invertase Pin-like site-specific DNA recombinase